MGVTITLLACWYDIICYAATSYEKQMRYSPVRYDGSYLVAQLCVRIWRCGSPVVESQGLASDAHRPVGQFRPIFRFRAGILMKWRTIHSSAVVLLAHTSLALPFKFEKHNLFRMCVSFIDTLVVTLLSH